MLHRAIRSAVFGVAVLVLAAVAHLPAQFRFQVVTADVVERRLKSLKGNDSQRQAIVKALFQEAGCTGENLIEQPVKRLKQSNVICVLPGSTSAVIVVGAHFDHADAGDGVVDNWTGASLLPSLYQALDSQQRRHTFLFLALAGEEKGLVGSRFYVQSLTEEQAKKIDATVIMDTLGLGPTEVWVSRSDKRLVNAFYGLAQLLKLPLTGVNVDKVGMSDEEPFIKRKIPVIMIHSLTKETISVLHSSRDNYGAVHFEDYYNSYKLLSGYLAFLDEGLGTQAGTPEKTPSN